MRTALLLVTLGSATVAAQEPGASDTEWEHHPLRWEASPYNWRNSPYRYKNWNRIIRQKELGEPATPPRRMVVKEYRKNSGNDYEVQSLQWRNGQF